MLLSMEYGDFKPHEADTFELDRMIAYKQSSKFNSRNVLTSKIFFLENYLLYSILFQGSHQGVIVVTYVVFLISLVFKYVTVWHC